MISASPELSRLHRFYFQSQLPTDSLRCQTSKKYKYIDRGSVTECGCAFQKPCEVEVGCVTEEGRVWVSRAGGAGLVQAALALLTAGPYRRPLPAAPQAPAPNATTLYIVRTLAGDWCVWLFSLLLGFTVIVTIFLHNLFCY